MRVKARKDGVDAYKLMSESNDFNHPIPYNEIEVSKYDGIFLPADTIKE